MPQLATYYHISLAKIYRPTQLKVQEWAIGNKTILWKQNLSTADHGNEWIFDDLKTSSKTVEFLDGSVREISQRFYAKHSDEALCF